MEDLFCVVTDKRLHACVGPWGHIGPLKLLKLIELTFKMETLFYIFRNLIILFQISFKQIQG